MKAAQVPYGAAVLMLGLAGFFPLLPTQAIPTFEEQVFRGTLLFQQGRWEEAARQWRAALKLDPNRADLQAQLGMAYYFGGELSAAISTFRKALRLNPQQLDAAYGLGLALYEKGDLDGAIKAFRTASRLNPAAYYNLGNTLEAKGEKAAALEAYRNYLAARPKGPEVRALGLAVKNGQLPTPAAGTAQEHFERGQLFLEQRDAEGAIREFLFALRLKPRYAEASNGLGLAFRMKGDLDEAMAAWETALRLDAKFAAPLRYLAEAWEERGDLARAALAYDRYLLLLPGAPDAKEVQEKIAELRKKQ